jgi:raffinose/stachyose/melibiose transport system substrate-binding protein
MDDSESSAQGIISPIYFEPSRNVTRAARFGIYQNGEIVSANVQFEPIANPNEIKDLQAQIDSGRIMTVNGGYVYKANVVYAGIDLLGIDEIDIKTSTYKVDFYLWFRYRPNEHDPDFKPDEFVFTNAEGDTEIVPIRDESNSDGTVLKTYRVSGTFKNQFKFYDYPFEHQDLIVEFRNQNATTSFIQYVVDRTGMRYQSEDTLLKNYADNGAFDSIFGWKPQSVQVAQDIFPTFSTFGSPQNFGRSVATNYSLINVKVDIQRDSLQYIVKSLLPLLITLILAYITFFLPLGHEERLAVGSTALLTTAFFHLQLADSLPEIGYTVAMEYLFYASYIMSALIVLLETLSIRYEKIGEDAKKKADKQMYEDKRERLNTLGRIIYPVILLVVAIAGVLVYVGGFHFGPKSTESKRLVDQAIEASKPAVVASSPTGSPEAAGNQVKLTLSTWRPEDSKQIQTLLDEFQKYASAQGKNIVIEHRPVVSTNYDSILDIQLSRGEGPDLFYVRPFSVDGSIARYLTKLNDNLDLQSKYDPTKLVPWTNRSGTYYAVPFVGVVQGIYYNKALFRRYGLSDPKTWNWNEFLLNLQKIKDHDEQMIPIANALNATEDSEMFMSIAANFLGGPDGRARLMKTDGTSLCYNNSVVTSAFQAVEDLEPYLPPEAATINSQNSKELFFKQQAVMLFGGSWDLQTVSQKAVFDWDVFAVPSPNAQTYVIFQPDVGIGLNRSSAHPEEARMFLDWLTQKAAVDLTAKNLLGFYPLNLTKSDQASGANDAKFLSLVNEYPGDIRWMFTEISNKYPRADVIIRHDLNSMIASDLTPQEAAQDLQNGLGEWYEPAQSCK